jgi:formylglycine-generating enzyme required for sulfatase activity
MRHLFLIITLLLALDLGRANNVIISNVSQVTHPFTFEKTINFTLSWENSWRIFSPTSTTQNNYDGVFVFFKYRTETGEWKNLPITMIYGVPPNFEFSTYGNAQIFYRQDFGIGTISGDFISIPAVVLPFDVEIRGFAVEMVQIPNAPTNHSLGDGNQITESANAFHFGDNTYSYYGQFTNVDVNDFDDAELETPNTFVVASGLQDLTINNLNFPTIGVFWCMKYEISQGAYRDFLNTLNANQQTTRTANLPTSTIGTGALTTSGNNRNFIEIKYPSIDGFPADYGCDASGNNIFDEANDGEFLACNFLSWPDIAAWLDWAGLAPMTEIHFEKICKNNYNNVPIAGEYAWENKLIHSSALTLSNPYTQSELVSNSSTTLGNAIFIMSGLDGPVRNGIFSTVTTTNRKQSGAAYYGVMDMSGNLSEACVTVGNVAGRSYNKLGLPGLSRGDGILSPNGNASVSYWPGNVAGATMETVATAEVTTGAGTINRGGSWNSPKEQLSIADRSGGEVSASRLATQGGRGVIVVSMY